MVTFQRAIRAASNDHNKMWSTNWPIQTKNLLNRRTKCRNCAWTVSRNTIWLRRPRMWNIGRHWRPDNHFIWIYRANRTTMTKLDLKSTRTVSEARKIRWIWAFIVSTAWTNLTRPWCSDALEQALCSSKLPKWWWRACRLWAPWESEKNPKTKITPRSKKTVNSIRISANLPMIKKSKRVKTRGVKLTTWTFRKIMI